MTTPPKKHVTRSKTVLALLAGIIMQTGEMLGSTPDIQDWGVLFTMIAGVVFRVLASHLLTFAGTSTLNQED